MSDTVYALIGYDRYYPGGDNTIRVFDNRRSAERWQCLLEAAKDCAHFPVTYAELEQDFEWIPGRKYGIYDVVEHEVYEHGYES